MIPSRKEVDRLDHILTGYLAFGKDQEAVRETFDLGGSVRRSVELVAGELQEAGIVVEMEVDLPEAPVRGDPRRVQQVLLNLLINARDAMPDGGRIGIALTTFGGSATLTRCTMTRSHSGITRSLCPR